MAEQPGIEQSLKRVQETYAERDRAMPPQDHRANVYHPRHPVGRLFRRHNQDILRAALNAVDLDVGDIKVLDVGCGSGNWLRHLVELGAAPSNLAGIDSSKTRLAAAVHTSPPIHWVFGDASALPFADAAFDMVLQIVVMSSIPDTDARHQVAAEIRRVVRRDGYCVWVDLRPRTRGGLVGFSRADVLELFPDFVIRISRPVHPRYFRTIGARLGLLAELAYAIAPVGCESSMYVLQRVRS